MDKYPKRLIEVDLPIKAISHHGRNEKNIRSNHPWNLHIWWARRPWGVCRSLALAMLLPAPSDENCPETFIKNAIPLLQEVGFNMGDGTREQVETALLRFMAEYARWEAGSDRIWRNVARHLIQAAYPEHTPLIFDPFSGYGAIPGEAARLGCTAIASDLNPVALLCLRTLLEAAPRHGEKLIEKFREGMSFIKSEAERRLAPYYPKREGRHPIAWLWARTVTCEGPGCGAEIPLISQTTIANGTRKAWIEISGDSKTKNVQIEVKTGASIPHELKKTAGGGHAVCPVCGYTTNKARVKVQGKEGRMGHRPFGVAMALGSRSGKTYANISPEDHAAYEKAVSDWQMITRETPLAEPTEKYPYHDPRAFTAGQYGIKTWGDLFSPRQKLALHTIGKILRDYESKLVEQSENQVLVRDVVTALALSVSNSLHYSTNMSTWLAEHMISCFITGNAIAMRWDWAEANPLVSEYVGGLDYSLEQSLNALSSTIALQNTSTTVMRANAAELPLPDDSADVFFTDPPYYDVVPYADLSDICYVWLKRFVGHLQPDFLNSELTPKAEQIVVNPYAIIDGRGDQSPQHYQERMTQAFREGRRVLKPNGIGCIVFAHKGTTAWETLLASVIDAGFVVTASWPIDTERAARMRANKSAALSSSVHIIIRPRENLDGSIRTDEIGDWHDVLQELPRRIHEWMPRLAKEGVVGADAIFACLGPALEIFSRYSSVEKASGEKVTLREYLEQVWAAVAREALNMIFEGADASGFEEDARLTAIWLWTLATAATDAEGSSEERDTDDEENGEKKNGKTSGYALEYDAARKIAQGLGIHLEDLASLVTVQGDTVVLLSVAARTRYLFGKDSAQSEPITKSKKKEKQITFDFITELQQIEQEAGSQWAGEFKGKLGKTILDQLHQSMILFAAGRGDALKRLLVDEGIGKNAFFWRLAQALSALYPSQSEEKRWVDGVLARKKGLGL